MIRKRMPTGEKRGKGQLFFYLVLILGGVLIFRFGRNIYFLWQAQKKVGQAQEQLETLKKEQVELLKKKEYYQSEAFVEQQARDKLSLAKEGETLVVLPEEEKETAEQTEPDPAKLTNWQRWARVFGWGD